MNRVSVETERNEVILDFYRGIGTDHRERALSQILQTSDKWLEETHDYIQWLFPLYVGCEFNLNAPLLIDEVGAAFSNPYNPDRGMLLGREPLALSIHACLTAAARRQPNIISDRTVGFWNDAIATVPNNPE